MRLRNNRWRIYWRYAGKSYEAFILINNMDENRAKAILDQTNAALSGRPVEFPVEIQDSPAIKNYIASINPPTIIPEESDLLRKYHQNLMANTTSDDWQKASMSKINEFLQRIKTIDAITEASTLEFLDYLIIHPDTGLATRYSTRNRVQAMLSRFFNWLRICGYRDENWNPLKNIKEVAEPHPEEGIIALSEEEVNILLEAADQQRGGIAIWIAILAGPRLGEIHRLTWDEITPSVTIIRKSKTHISRTIPISIGLKERLAREPRLTNSNRIVPFPAKWGGWLPAATRLIDRLRPLVKTEIGWNIFRHTFASRAVQAGIAISIVAAWMGNDPEVCERHYARFVPAYGRDTRIDAIDPKRP